MESASSASNAPHPAAVAESAINKNATNVIELTESGAGPGSPRFLA